jgi:hypothetical protein
MTQRADPQAQAIRFAEGEPALSAFADYLRSKFAGRKVEAKAASERFCAELDVAAPDAAIQAVRRLAEAQSRFGGLPGFMPYPVALAASRVCQRWEREDPSLAEPLVLRAGFEWDPSLYAQALKRDPGHPSAIRGYVGERLRWLSAAFHTIERGRLSEPEPEVRETLLALRPCLDIVSGPELAQEGRALVDLYQRLLEELQSWRELGAETTFADHMKAQGVDLAALPELLD